MDRLEYAAGLQPSIWRRLSRELVTWIAEALRDLLFSNDSDGDQSWPRELAMTCRMWRTLFSPLWWSSCKSIPLTRPSQLHKLEEIISSPLSGTAKDHINDLRLCPGLYGNDEDKIRFFSAWRSLSRRLHQVIHLQIGAFVSGPPQLESPSISLRPCPRPLLHIRILTLVQVSFPTFSALFRDIGALPSLEQLRLHHIQWKGACDPESPPSSTAIFGDIKHILANKCTDVGWPLIWIFTASLLRYRHPWRVPDDAEETRIRSVRADVRAIGQVFRWVLSSAGAANDAVRLAYVDCAPKGI